MESLHEGEVLLGALVIIGFVAIIVGAYTLEAINAIKRWKKL